MTSGASPASANTTLPPCATCWQRWPAKNHQRQFCAPLCPTVPQRVKTNLARTHYLRRLASAQRSIPKPAGSEKPKLGSSEGPRFRWRSGDSTWTRALESEPLSSVWRQALESQHLTANEPSGAGSQPEVVRVVAIPLRSGTENLGVLVAGIRRVKASENILER